MPKKDRFGSTLYDSRESQKLSDIAANYVIEKGYLGKELYSKGIGLCNRKRSEVYQEIEETVEELLEDR